MIRPVPPMHGGEGAKGAIFSAIPAQGGPANTNLKGIKSLPTEGGGGGGNCGSPGPQGNNWPWAPIFH
jgi:hypothetical protein